MSRLELYIVPFGSFCDSHALGKFRLCVSSLGLQRVCVHNRAFPTCLCDRMLPIVVCIL